jgi:hypothetical protein
MGLARLRRLQPVYARKEPVVCYAVSRPIYSGDEDSEEVQTLAESYSSRAHGDQKPYPLPPGR